MKSVLIVDDAAFMRFAIKKILEKNGFKIAGEAENGLVAVEKYKVLKPDIVTMDLTMPEMSGLEAIKKICEYDNNAYIIVVSAMGQDVMVKEAIINGAKSFIVKPFKEEVVINALNKAL